MVDYYRILNLSMQKKQGKITDELVKKYYDEAMKRDKEYNNFFDDEILNDAYRALANENARKHYDELMDMLETHEQTKKAEKRKNIEPKTRKVDTNKGKISNLKTAMQNMSKSPDTKEILKQIKEQAEKEHPISKPEELGER